MTSINHFLLLIVAVCIATIFAVPVDETQNAPKKALMPGTPDGTISDLDSAASAYYGGYGGYGGYGNYGGYGRGYGGYGGYGGWGRGYQGYRGYGGWGNGGYWG